MKEDINYMSLRTFHIVFVSVTSLLMCYILGWSYMMWDYYSDTAYLSYLVFSIIGLVILVFYGQRFIKKYKNI